MEQSQLVILFGMSLLLAGLETCLHGLPGIQVLQLDDTTPDAMDRLKALKPHAVIFDRNDHALQDWNRVARLLEENSRATVIGLDVNSDDLFVLYNQASGASHLDEVVAAIRARSHPNS